MSKNHALKLTVESSDWGGKALIALILLLAISLRIAAAIYLPDQHFPDAAAYRETSTSIWRFGRFDNPYIMPLYPLAIALTGHGWGQILFDTALSVASVWLIYLLTLILFCDRVAARLAAFAAAVYPYFIFYAVVGLTETLFITLVLSAFTSWYRGWFVTAAIFATLSILTRPTIDLLPPILITYFALVIHRFDLNKTVKYLAIYGLTYCALMSPWWIHNYNTYGNFVRLNLGSGLALYSGNNPRNLTGGVSDVQLDTATFDLITDPVARDRALREAALNYIAADPYRFLHLAGLKFLRFWRLWPFAESYSGSAFVVVSFLSFAPVLFCSLVTTLRSDRQTLVKIVPIGIFIGYLTLVHMVIVGSIRYRLPAEPFLIVLAAPTFRQVIAFCFGLWRGSPPRRIPR